VRQEVRDRIAAGFIGGPKGIPKNRRPMIVVD
jgi:hypothetical protein